MEEKPDLIRYSFAPANSTVSMTRVDVIRHAAAMHSRASTASHMCSVFAVTAGNFHSSLDPPRCGRGLWDGGHLLRGKERPSSPP